MYFEWPILIINIADLMFWVALLLGGTVAFYYLFCRKDSMWH